MADRNALIITTELHYRDPDAALAWLAHAFGFRTRMVVADERGRIVFAETGLSEATVAIVPEEPETKRSPQALSGANTQAVRVRGDFDVESHCARARAAGATIVQEPMQFFFGDRVYVAADLEGHLWSFAQRIPGAGGPPPDGWSITFPSRGEGPHSKP
jgi:uncharacterized glyoxalase superfamily protein PhnB